MFKHGITVKITLKIVEVGIKGTSVFIAQLFFFLFKSGLSILDSGCETVRVSDCKNTGNSDA